MVSRKRLWIGWCAALFLNPFPVALAKDQFAEQMKQFERLSGPDKVAVIFHDKLYGRSLWFWKRSTNRMLSQADWRLARQQEIVVRAADASIDRALVIESRSAEVARVQYAVFLICLRAMYVRPEEIPLRDANWFSGNPPVSFSPFGLNPARIDSEGQRAIEKAINSSHPELRRTAKLFSFELLKDLRKLPTAELVRQWRDQITRTKCELCYSDDEEQLAFLLKRAITERGLGAAVAIAAVLEDEKNEYARDREVDLILQVDRSAVRLSSSREGREAIETVRLTVLSRPLRYCTMRYNQTDKDRYQTWSLLKSWMLEHKTDCAADSWATMIAFALDREYGDHLSTLSDGSVRCNARMDLFLRRLAEDDPTYPAWIFPSTGDLRDAVHPRFKEKLQRYQDALQRLP